VKYLSYYEKYSKKFSITTFAVD